ncbi:DMT family transporter [Clostridium sp. 19966]|uniref:DMT family transporter n=1 Tax=Clostridium sp. 19966 TaxID=2768166 RepID=UPI0028DE068A|nr:DMT family transporter [Clostridium sp. 19966]MDT8717504.1 DMT family transporter [Clostridium sp. 19966]
MGDKKIFTNGKFVAIIATICCLLWGSAYPAVKKGYLLFNIASGDIPSKLLFAGYRFFLAGIILLFISKLSGKSLLKFSKKAFSQLLILGLLQTTLQYIFFYIGLANTTGVKGAVLNSMVTFFSVILAHFIYANDKLNKRKSLGCIIGFIGVVIVNFSSNLLDFSFTLNGDGFVVIAAFVFSVAAIYCKRLTVSMDVMVVTGYSLFIGGAVLILLGEIYGGRVYNFITPSSLILIYLAILSSAAFSLWNLLLKYNKVGLVSVYNFLTPIFGAVLSAIFLGENILELKNVAALILVCAGIWMVNYTGRKYDV